jgi:bifunctional DNA-binding transcriptional regulator/antitoxin component of YhaV-PrlF toxin-antitoxin module
MADINELVNGIQIKVKKLIALNKVLTDENSQLKEKQVELINNTEDQKKIIKQLKDKNNFLKIAKSVKQFEGNADVKSKIDELVREIDKCIGLLNK